jgi:GNAT superfamily N-acetyltransferase
VIVMAFRRIDLDRARREAKALLAAARAGDSEALGRLRSDRKPQLADAQHAVARELGERSWPALVRRVQARGSALLQAARAGDVEAVYQLLDAGAPPNAREAETGATALHLAASRGWLDVVDALVGWVPVDKHARDARGRTALGACIEGTGDLVVAKVLVSVGLGVEAAMLDHASGPLAAWLRARVKEPPEREPLPERFGESALSAEVAMFRLLADSPLTDTRAIGDGFAFATGQRDNTRNGVVCSRLPADRADDEIADVLAWLREHDAPAQWFVQRRTAPADLRERLQRAGCQAERTAVHMAAQMADLDLSPRPAPDNLDVRLIQDEASLAEALDDADDAKLLTSLNLDPTAPVRHYVARLVGRTVGVTSTVIDDTTLGVVELEVRPAERRRGVGRALLLHALREGLVAGCSVATLAPTPATVPFYEALGLRLERYPRDRCFYTP